MSASPLDSAIYRHLYGDTDMARLFSDTAEVRALMLTLGALARVQGQTGAIPEIAATAIHRASMELQLDPGGLARATADAASPVPRLVEMFRAAMQAPEYAQHLAHDATGDDIADTALALRLRQALALLDTRLAAATGDLRDLHARLAPLREDVARVTLAGDADTRARLAEALNLSNPASPRAQAIARLADWLTATAAARADTGALHAAIHHQATALNAALQSACQTGANPAAARMLEQLSLPQLVILTARALAP